MTFLFGSLIFIGIAVIIYFLIRKPSLFNSFVRIRRINPEHIVKEGDFSFYGRTLQVRMRWVTKTVNLSQIISIKSFYKEEDGGEELRYIAINFESGTALLHPADLSHQQVLNQIFLALDLQPVDWTSIQPEDKSKTFYKAPLLYA